MIVGRCLKYDCKISKVSSFDLSCEESLTTLDNILSLLKQGRGLGRFRLLCFKLSIHETNTISNI